MPTHSVTLEVPEATYSQIERAAGKVRRPVTDLLVEAIIAAAPVAESADASLRASIAQMVFLTDAALWRAARATIPRTQRDRLAALHDKAQREGLSTADVDEEAGLMRLYTDTLLVRAQAAVLLKQRGYDVSAPEQFAPIE